jgi:hypothetical protein
MEYSLTWCSPAEPRRGLIPASLHRTIHMVCHSPIQPECWIGRIGTLPVSPTSARYGSSDAAVVPLRVTRPTWRIRRAPAGVSRKRWPLTASSRGIAQQMAPPLTATIRSVTHTLCLRSAVEVQMAEGSRHGPSEPLTGQLGWLCSVR